MNLNWNHIFIAVLLTLAGTALIAEERTQLAFPTAEGYGRFA